MTVVVDDTTLVRCVAMTALPEFIDITGTITGTRNATYNPTFVGERGFMLNVDAVPLGLGVEITGDQLAICYLHTPLEIDEAIEAATPIVVAARAAQSAPTPPVAPRTTNISPRRVPAGAKPDDLDDILQ